MSDWDGGAAARLAWVVSELEAAGFVQECRRLARKVWTANLARYEPSELGDTKTSLGFAASTNLSELLERSIALGVIGGRNTPVASRPDGSLLVTVGDIRLHVMKAPPSPRPEPTWSDFSWSESDSKTRMSMARRNSLVYRPAASDQAGREHLLVAPDGETLWNDPEEASALCDCLLVWWGHPEAARTSGWLTFPSQEGPAFFAVAKLWEDNGGRQKDVTQGPSSPKPDADSFSDREEPSLNLGLKKKPVELRP